MRDTTLWLLDFTASTLSSVCHLPLLFPCAFFMSCTVCHRLLSSSMFTYIHLDIFVSIWMFLDIGHIMVNKQIILIPSWLDSCMRSFFHFCSFFFLGHVGFVLFKWFQTDSKLNWVPTLCPNKYIQTHCTKPFSAIDDTVDLHSITPTTVLSLLCMHVLPLPLGGELLGLCSVLHWMMDVSQFSGDRAALEVGNPPSSHQGVWVECSGLCGWPCWLMLAGLHACLPACLPAGLLGCPLCHHAWFHLHCWLMCRKGLSQAISLWCRKMCVECLCFDCTYFVIGPPTNRLPWLRLIAVTLFILIVW